MARLQSATNAALAVVVTPTKKSGAKAKGVPSGKAGTDALGSMATSAFIGSGTRGGETQISTRATAAAAAAAKERAGYEGMYADLLDLVTTIADSPRLSSPQRATLIVDGYNAASAVEELLAGTPVQQKFATAPSDFAAALVKSDIGISSIADRAFTAANRLSGVTTVLKARITRASGRTNFSGGVAANAIYGQFYGNFVGAENAANAALAQLAGITGLDSASRAEIATIRASLATARQQILSAKTEYHQMLVDTLLPPRPIRRHRAGPVASVVVRPQKTVVRPQKAPLPKAERQAIHRARTHGSATGG